MLAPSIANPENAWSTCRAAPDGGDDAAGNADQHGDANREQRQEERRLRALGERLRHRPLQEDRLAEVASRELAQPVDELHRQRLVEAVGRTQLRDVGGRRLFAEHHRCRIARRKARDEEDERRHEQHDDHHAGEPRREIAGHVPGTADRVTYATGPTAAPRIGRRAEPCALYFCSPVFQKKGHGMAT